MKVYDVLVPALTKELPLLLETSYLVIVAPPLLDGADQLRATCPFPGVALKFCGAVGISAGVVKAISELCPAPEALLFLAIARAVYDVLGLSPVIVVLNGLAVPLTSTSLWGLTVSFVSRIQKPRVVIVAPPVFVIFPVRTTVVLVVVPLEIVSVGNAATGVADTDD